MPPDLTNDAPHLHLQVIIATTITNPVTYAVRSNDKSVPSWNSLDDEPPKDSYIIIKSYITGCFNISCYEGTRDVSEYQHPELTEPSAIKYCVDVPPDFLIVVAVRMPETLRPPATPYPVVSSLRM